MSDSTIGTTDSTSQDPALHELIIVDPLASPGVIPGTKAGVSLEHKR